MQHCCLHEAKAVRLHPALLSQLPYHTRPGVTSLIMRIRNPRLQFFVRNAAQTVHLPLALICP